MAKTLAVTDSSSTGMQQLKNQPQRLKDFLKEVRSEMKKVWWPSWPEVQTTTIVVLVTTFMFAAFFWLVDNIFGQLIERMLHALSGT